MVMVSPYLSMLKSGSSIPAGEFNIAVDKHRQPLGTAKDIMNLLEQKEGAV